MSRLMCACVAAKWLIKYVVLPEPCRPMKIMASAMVLISVGERRAALLPILGCTTIDSLNVRVVASARPDSYHRVPQNPPEKSDGRQRSQEAGPYIYRSQCSRAARTNTSAPHARLAIPR